MSKSYWRWLLFSFQQVWGRLPIVFLLLGLISAAVGCQQQRSQPPPADTRAADEAAIRAASGAWMSAMAERDVEKTISFMAADIKAWWGGKEEVDKEVIRQDVTADLADPNYALTWEINKVKVARSGDLAYEMGSYQETKSDSKKRPQTRTGKYVTIWEKQADRTWKATVDIGNPNQ